MPVNYIPKPLLRLSDLPAERIEHPLLVGTPLRLDQQALGTVAGESVNHCLGWQKLQAVNHKITIRI